MKTFTVLTQTYHQPELTEIAIKSFEKFKPDDYEIHYVVVEGSDDVSYRDKILSISEKGITTHPRILKIQSVVPQLQME